MSPYKAFVPPMLDRGHHLSLRGTVAGELIRDHHARHTGLTLQQLAKQALGGPLVAPALDQDVEHDPILVHRAPEGTVNLASGRRSSPRPRPGATCLRHGGAGAGSGWRTPGRTCAPTGGPSRGGPSRGGP